MMEKIYWGSEKWIPPFSLPLLLFHYVITRNNRTHGYPYRVDVGTIGYIDGSMRKRRYFSWNYIFTFSSTLIDRDFKSWNSNFRRQCFSFHYKQNRGCPFEFQLALSEVFKCFWNFILLAKKVDRSSIEDSSIWYCKRISLHVILVIVVWRGSPNKLPINLWERLSVVIDISSTRHSPHSRTPACPQRIGTLCSWPSLSFTTRTHQPHWTTRCLLNSCKRDTGLWETIGF